MTPKLNAQEPGCTVDGDQLCGILLRGVAYSEPFGGKEILSGLDLLIRPGKVTAVIGPNGAGKSTLLRVACGYLASTRGEVTLDGFPLRSIDNVTRGRRVGYLPQHVDVRFPFSALELVLMGADVRSDLYPTNGEKRKRAMEALEELGVAGVAHQVFSTLSGGEQRLVLLAKMGLQSPDYCLLDEPTAALDWANSQRVVDRMVELGKKGIGVVSVLHDLNQAVESSDHLVLLRRSECIWQGPTAVLPLKALENAYGTRFEAIQHPFRQTRMFVS